MSKLLIEILFRAAQKSLGTHRKGAYVLTYKTRLKNILTNWTLYYTTKLFIEKLFLELISHFCWYIFPDDLERLCVLVYMVVYSTIYSFNRKHLHNRLEQTMFTAGIILSKQLFNWTVVHYGVDINNYPKKAVSSNKKSNKHTPNG